MTSRPKYPAAPNSLLNRSSTLSVFHKERFADRRVSLFPAGVRPVEGQPNRGNTPCPREQPSTTRRQQNTPHMLLDTTQKLANTMTLGNTRRPPTMRTPRTGTPPTLDITPRRQLGRTPRSTVRNNAAWERDRLSWRVPLSFRGPQRPDQTEQSRRDACGYSTTFSAATLD
jgi:hypothetical protein